MKSYRSRNGKPSDVVGFKIEAESISVQFTNREVRVYTYVSAGEDVVEMMKSLALDQLGLATFISQNNPPYSNKY